MKIIVHTGMHNTGCDALRTAFLKASGEAYACLDHNEPNLSRALTVAFTNDTNDKNTQIRHPREADAERLSILENLEAQMDACDLPVMLVSSTALASNAGDRQKNIASWLAQHSDDHQVISYVRAPLPHMELWFQSQIKNRLVDLNPEVMFPYYRNRLAGLLQNFQRQKCDFVLCDATMLSGSNLVVDFAQRTGLPVPDTVGPVGQPQLSAPAVCLQYLYRKHIQNELPSTRPELLADRKVTEFFRRITGPQFQLSHDVLETNKDRIQRQIDWMERALQAPLKEDREPVERTFATDSDLLQGAEDAHQSLRGAFDQIGVRSTGSLLDDLAELQAHMQLSVNKWFAAVPSIQSRGASVSNTKATADANLISLAAKRTAKPSKPDLRIIVHAGMHKTGSTSLQVAFANHNSDQYHYLLGSEANFSMSLYLMFEDEAKLQDHLYHRISQISLDDLRAKKAAMFENISNQIATTDKPTLVISGEDISGYNPRSIKRFAEFLRGYSDDISVLTYIRPPCAYMESAFQERLKHQLVEPDPIGLWPRYQRRLECVIDAFGSDRNTFLKFERQGLLNGNIIDDFSSRVGLPRPKDVDSEVNASMSAEAVALIYAYRKLVNPEPPAGTRAQRADRLFLKRIEAIGTRKLRFDKSYREAGQTFYVDDLEWMERQMGASLDETCSTGPGFITGSADLLKLAHDALPDLKSLNAALGIAKSDSLEETLRAFYSDCERQQALIDEHEQVL
ncbi:MAG: hypothetical protein MK160_01395 [Rhodobacteraceae bacterium]|nr:hypothetical protein [Paracoccaceae bacterium]